MTILNGLLLLFAFAAAAPAQDAPAWESRQTKDPFRGTEFTEFRLEGKYLAPPARRSANPELVLRCMPGPRAGKFDGRMADAFLIAGKAHLEHTRRTKKNSSRVTMQYRLDDGKIHTEYLSPSTDFTSVSLQKVLCGNCVLDDFFYGHQMAHREGSSPQMKKVVVSLPEHRSTDIVMEFVLPDVTEVAQACGVTMHK